MDNKMITQETIKDMKQTVDALFMDDLIKCLKDHQDAIVKKIEEYKNDLTSKYKELKERYPGELSKKLENSEAIKGLIQSTVTQSNQQINSLLNNLIEDKKNLCADSIVEAKKCIVSGFKKETYHISKSLNSLPIALVQKLKDSGSISEIIDQTVSTKTKETEKILDGIVKKLVEERGKKDNEEITMVKEGLTKSISSFQSIIKRRINVVTILVVLNTLLILVSLIFKVI